MINPRILNILSENFDKYQYPEAILYLLSVYFEIEYANFSDDIIRKVNHLKIFEKDLNNDSIIWNISLLGDDITPDFIERYRDIFRYADRTKAGSRQTVIKKMTEFRKEHPYITNEQIIEAAENYVEHYLQNNLSTQYLQQADYFIKKERNPAGSKLELWLEIIKESKERGLEVKNIADNIL